jgi:hypothetical protein
MEAPQFRITLLPAARDRAAERHQKTDKGRFPDIPGIAVRLRPMPTVFLANLTAGRIRTM